MGAEIFKGCRCPQCGARGKSVAAIYMSSVTHTETEGEFSERGMGIGIGSGGIGFGLGGGGGSYDEQSEGITKLGKLLTPPKLPDPPTPTQYFPRALRVALTSAVVLFIGWIISNFLAYPHGTNPISLFMNAFKILFLPMMLICIVAGIYSFFEKKPSDLVAWEEKAKENYQTICDKFVEVQKAYEDLRFCQHCNVVFDLKGNAKYLSETAISALLNFK